MKQKKLLAAFLAAAMTVACLTQAAIAEPLPQEAETQEEGAEQDFIYETLSDETIAIIGYRGSSDVVDIPEEIDGKTVTEIGQSAFWFNNLITKVILPDTVTVIRDSAFNACSMQEIVLSQNLETIERYAFNNCHSLTAIDLPDTLTSIGDRAFQECMSLKEITIPKNVTEIGNLVFNGWSALEAIYVDDENEYFQDIEGVLFDKEGTTLLKYPPEKAGTTYTIPQGVTTVDEIAFEFCSLQEISIPDSVTELKNSAFYACSSLTKINLPESLTDIQYRTFSWCSSLPEIEIPENVKTIDNFAFENCQALKKAVVPESVTFIASNAFSTEGSPDLTFYGYSSSYAETYAQENNIPFVSIDIILEGDYGISVFGSEEAVSDAVTLNVTQGESTETSVSYDLTLTDSDGNKVQPKGQVTVEIPVPEGWDESSIYVYYRDTTGKLTDMHPTILNGYITFSTDHFSEYVISQEKTCANGHKWGEWEDDPNNAGQQIRVCEVCGETETRTTSPTGSTGNHYYFYVPEETTTSSNETSDTLDSTPEASSEATAQPDNGTQDTASSATAAPAETTAPAETSSPESNETTAPAVSEEPATSDSEDRVPNTANYPITGGIVLIAAASGIISAVSAKKRK